MSVDKRIICHPADLSWLHMLHEQVQVVMTKLPTITVTYAYHMLVATDRIHVKATCIKSGTHQ